MPLFQDICSKAYKRDIVFKCIDSKCLEQLNRTTDSLHTELSDVLSGKEREVTVCPGIK